MYGLKIIHGPQEEPITQAELKDYARIDFATEDDIVDRNIAAARRYLERDQRRAFVRQTWQLSLEGFPTGSWTPLFGNGDYTIRLPKPPLIDVESISYLDAAGSRKLLAPSDYVVDATSEPGRIIPAYGKTWPVCRRQPGSVLVAFECGYGDAADVPEDVKLLTALFAAHWFEQREASVESAHVTKIPYVMDLLDANRAEGYP